MTNTQIHWSMYATTEQAILAHNVRRTEQNAPARDADGNRIFHSFQGYMNQAIAIAHEGLGAIHADDVQKAIRILRAAKMHALANALADRWVFERKRREQLHQYDQD